MRWAPRADARSPRRSAWSCRRVVDPGRRQPPGMEPRSAGASSSGRRGHAAVAIQTGAPTSTRLRSRGTRAARPTRSSRDCEARRATSSIGLDDFADRASCGAANVRRAALDVRWRTSTTAGGLPEIDAADRPHIAPAKINVTPNRRREHSTARAVDNDDVIRPSNGPSMPRARSRAAATGDLRLRDQAERDSANYASTKGRPSSSMTTRLSDARRRERRHHPRTCESPSATPVRRAGTAMPEHGACVPIPTEASKQGVRDMRVSEARMSGTSTGACVLHFEPEAKWGGCPANSRCGRPRRHHRA